MKLTEITSDENWDIMSGTAVDDKEIAISASGMTKIEFDCLILSIQTRLEMQGWIKSYPGLLPNDNFEVRFKLRGR